MERLTVTAAEICDAIRVSAPTLRDMVERGDFPPPLRTGTRNKLWPKHALETYLGLEQQTTGEIPVFTLTELRESVAREIVGELVEHLASFRPKAGSHACP